MLVGAAIELVVTDLDGTLWEREGEVHERTLEAIDELAVREVPLLVATGRREGSTRRGLERAGLAPPAVLLNGSLGVDLASGERFHLGGFEPDEALGVLAAFEANGVDPCVYVDGQSPSVFVSERPATHPQHLASFGDSVAVASLAEIVASQRVLAFAVFGIDGEPGAKVAAALGGFGTSHFAADRIYGGHGLSVAPRGDSKWDGVAAFCQHRGLDAGRVLAIGDGPNDVEMLVTAAVAVVPSDGHVDALARADRVVDPASAGGWADLLDLL